MLFSVLLYTLEILYDEGKQHLFKSFLISHLHFLFASLNTRDQCPLLKLILLYFFCMWVKCSIQFLHESCLSWQPWHLQTMERVDRYPGTASLAGRHSYAICYPPRSRTFPWGWLQVSFAWQIHFHTCSHTLFCFPCEIKKKNEICTVIISSVNTSSCL